VDRPFLVKRLSAASKEDCLGPLKVGKRAIRSPMEVLHFDTPVATSKRPILDVFEALAGSAIRRSKEDQRGGDSVYPHAMSS